MINRVRRADCVLGCRGSKGECHGYLLISVSESHTEAIKYHRSLTIIVMEYG